MRPGRFARSASEGKTFLACASGQPNAGTPVATRLSHTNASWEVFLLRNQPCVEDSIMLRLALLFLVVSLIAALLGFSGVAWAGYEIAKVIFFIFLVLFIVALLGGLMGRPTDVV